jgi:glycosyltransferase involved in cell wall biosynthesis
MNILESSKVILRTNKKSILPESQLPLVSYIIPVLNSERSLEKCIRTILFQKYPRIEVIVIDNGSTDNSFSIAKKLGVKVLSLDGPLGEVRQLGITEASGELISLWDSDAYLPHENWLSEAVSALVQSNKTSTLWIRTIDPPNASNFSRGHTWYSWSLMLSFASRGIGFWGGGGSLFKKKALMEVGGITKGIDTGEDFDLAKKLANNGYKVLFYNDPFIHDPQNTFSQFVRKDIRRASNFKIGGLKSFVGVSIKDLVLAHVKLCVTATINLFTKRDLSFVYVPVIVLFRVIVYALIHLLR